MPVRVHGGEARGRVLQTPRGIRPSSGQVVEAIFNMLAEAIGGARVVDLYSGSGALGIEALSRGAAHVTFVERSEASASIVRRNLQELAFTERATVIRADALRWLGGHPGEVAAADIVLMDPPYADPGLERALRELDATVAAGCVVVAEHAAGRPLPALRRLEPSRTRRYGDSALTILRALPAA